MFIFSYFWSGLVSCVAFFFTVFNFFIKLKSLKSLTDRQNPNFQQIDPHKNKALFFCSSAGEYEQIIPLMNGLAKRNFINIVFFFSDSGLNYVKARGEVDGHFYLCSFDTIHYWRCVFKHFNPKWIFIVRYELWPSFIYEAKKQAPLFLLNVSYQKTSNNWLTKCLKKYFFTQMTKIFAVSKNDKKLLVSELKIPKKLIEISNDTKYDRVYERRQNNTASHFKDLTICEKKIIVAGSVWPKDVEVLSKAFNIYPDLKEDYLLVLVPHSISQVNIAEMKIILAEYKIKNSFWEEGNVENSTMDALIVDRMGFLAELYSVAYITFVGGGMHHRVHNVLEPSIYNKPVVFGPNYHNSHEAVGLVQSDLAKVIKNEVELYKSISEIKNNYQSLEFKFKNYMKQQLGSSEQILQFIEKNYD